MTRVTYNRLPLAITAHGHDPGAVPSVAELGRILGSAGLHAIPADVPEGMSAADYLAELRAAGLAPAPGYLQAPFESTAAVEQARRFAADQAELGLTEVFLACTLNELRMARPGEGTEPDAERLSRIGEHIGVAARAMTAEGVRPCLHPHVGSWIETADEADAVLAAVDPARSALGQ